MRRLAGAGLVLAEHRTKSVLREDRRLAVAQEAVADRRGIEGFISI